MKTMDDIIKSFFTHSFENDINYQLFFYDYSFQKNDVLNYINDLLSTPYNLFLDYIYEYPEIKPLTSKDVFQFSSIEDATTKICDKLNSIDDPGVGYVEIGKLLLDDGKVRNDIAYRKYGENHSKTAEQLGLVQFKYYSCYLSTFGKIFTKLSSSDQERLLARTALRNPLVKKVLSLSRDNSISVKNLIDFLSESTQNRRAPNIKTIMNLVLNNNEIDLLEQFGRISY